MRFWKANSCTNSRSYYSAFNSEDAYFFLAPFFTTGFLVSTTSYLGGLSRTKHKCMLYRLRCLNLLSLAMNDVKFKTICIFASWWPRQSLLLFRSQSWRNVFSERAWVIAARCFEDMWLFWSLRIDSWCGHPFRYSTKELNTFGQLDKFMFCRFKDVRVESCSIWVSVDVKSDKSFSFT